MAPLVSTYSKLYIPCSVRSTSSVSEQLLDVVLLLSARFLTLTGSHAANVLLQGYGQSTTSTMLWKATAKNASARALMELLPDETHCFTQFTYETVLDIIASPRAWHTPWILHNRQKLT